RTARVPRSDRDGLAVRLPPYAAHGPSLDHEGGATGSGAARSGGRERPAPSSHPGGRPGGGPGQGGSVGGDRLPAGQGRGVDPGASRAQPPRPSRGRHSGTLARQPLAPRERLEPTRRGSTVPGPRGSDGPTGGREAALAQPECRICGEESDRGIDGNGFGPTRTMTVEEPPVPVDVSGLSGFSYACRPGCGLCCYAEPLVTPAEKPPLLRIVPSVEFVSRGRFEFLGSHAEGGACR